MNNKEIREANKSIKEYLGKGDLEIKVKKLIKQGLVEIIGCDDDGFPIVTPTKKAIKLFKEKCLIQ